MLASLRSGKVSPQLARALASRGISQSQALAYGNATMNTMFRNIGMDKGPMGDLARGMLSGGYGSDFGAYLKANKGKKGFDGKQAVSTFAAILQSEGFASNDQQAEGMARMMAGLGNMSTLRKGGFRDAAAGTTTAAAADEAGKAKQEEARELNKMTEGEVRENIGKGARQIGDLGRNIGMSAEDVGNSLERLAKKLDSITQGLDKVEKRVQHG
jgi:hypothetical protein